LDGPDIFISYARDDVGFARRFADAFTREGFNVWWDAAIHSGETFDEVIEKALRAAKAVVVLWSPRSVASRWVRAEATLADRNKTLAPAIIEPCDRPIIFELTHTANLSHWSGDTSDGVWQVYLNDIRRLVEGTRSNPRTLIHPSEFKQQVSRQANPHPGPDAAGNDMLAGAKVDNLISALSTLHEAIMKSNAPTAQQPVVQPSAYQPGPQPIDLDDDEDEATQFYTGSDAFDLLGGDEFHCLELSVDGEFEKRFIIGPLGLKIGRTAPADVVLSDAKVSRSHCLVELKENLVLVSDLKSTNGTFVDGEKVVGASILPVGSALKVGRFSLVHEVRTRAEVS
jgi:hypothetical protein